MDGVFSYFVAIGAGLTTGVLAVLVPVALIYGRLKKPGRKGVNKDGIGAVGK